jgi:hypothetical protein
MAAPFAYPAPHYNPINTAHGAFAHRGLSASH